MGAETLPPHALATGRPPYGAAVVGVILLVGFYVLAVGIVAGSLVAPVWMVSRFEHWPYQIVLVGVVVAFIVGRGVVATVRRPPLVTDGIELTRADQPTLWDCVDEIAERVGIDGPDEIRLLNGTVVAVAEDSLLLGLRRGRRQLLLGAGVLRALTCDEFHAVVGHELGHYAHGDTRLGALHGRSAIALGRVMGDLGHGSLLGRLFGLYQHVFLRTTLPARRRQELAADGMAAAVSDAETAARALRRHVCASVAYEMLVSDYVLPMWRRDAQPDNLYTGFGRLLAAATEHATLHSFVEQELGRPADVLDSHPSIPERIAALGATADDEPWRARDADARELVIRLEELERALTGELTRATIGRETRPLRWEDYAREVLAAERQDAVHGLFEAAAWLEDVEGMDLGRFLEVVGGDRSGELVEFVSAMPPPEEVDRNLVRDMAVMAIGAALVDTGEAEWALAWSDRRLLVDETGRTIDLSAWLPPDLSTVADVLTEHVDPSLTSWVPGRAPQVAAEDGPAVVFDTVHHANRTFDLLVYDDALVLARARLGGLDRVRVHLMRVTGWVRAGYDPTARIHAMAGRSREDIVSDHRRNRLVDGGDIVDLRLRARPSGWRLDVTLRDGSRLKVVSDAGQHDKTFTKLVLEDVLGVTVTATDRTFWG